MPPISAASIRIRGKATRPRAPSYGGQEQAACQCGGGGQTVEEKPADRLAWQNALVLWALRPDPAASGLFLDGLAATTALAGRLLLTAV